MNEQDKQLAIVFPGQGSQTVGMLESLAKEFAIIGETFEQASAVLGYDLWQLIQQGPEEKLNQTQFTQPALLAADVAVWRCWLQVDGPLPQLMAGHSLGEYSALVCAGALDFADAVRLVAKRGIYMQEAVAEGVGAMAAIVGLDYDQVAAICKEISEISSQDAMVSPANFNSIDQIVVAGHAKAVASAIVKAKNLGAKIAKLIPVTVPSHCILMQKAVELFAHELQEINFKKVSLPVIHNYDVASHFDAYSLREVLAKQLIYPVRWVETIQNMAQQGIKVVVECGPGKVLTGLNKRINSELTTYSTADITQFQAAVSAMRGVTVCH